MFYQTMHPNMRIQPDQNARCALILAADAERYIWMSAFSIKRPFNMSAIHMRWYKESDLLHSNQDLLSERGNG